MVKQTHKILHICPHLGGGVGRFFANILACDRVNDHLFLLLEPPENSDFLSSTSISWQLWDGNSKTLNSLVGLSSIVEIDFWNHPALLSFLNENPLRDVRVLVYSFVSGHAPPNLIPEAIVNYADWIALPGPSSLDDPQLVRILERHSVIFALGGVSRTSQVKLVPHDKTVVSYVGTAGHEKLHPNFIYACNRILKRHPNTRFQIATNDTSDHLKSETISLNISKQFDFQVKVNDIAKFHRYSDIFGYPLKSDHYGTAEQALLEAMGAGIPPVVLDNHAEKYLIEDGRTGLVASSIDQYADLVSFLIENPEFRLKLGHNARHYAADEFAAYKTMEKLHSTYNEIASLPCKDRLLEVEFFTNENRGWILFTLCLGQNAPPILYDNATCITEKNYWLMKSKSLSYTKSKKKGGLLHYLEHFPNDRKLISFHQNLVSRSS